ncbi:hypothetical protein JZ751_023384 [Albula glossodonta]|uniref:Uncharacterized protein n=1 Tax=Albula glossodonta TaxID=121402 RepID=A0A8T2NTR5_9TELE|nr:hypothetical protein JZ751_023384 [Albula glossodonta]
MGLSTEGVLLAQPTRDLRAFDDLDGMQNRDKNICQVARDCGFLWQILCLFSVVLYDFQARDFRLFGRISVSEE